MSLGPPDELCGTLCSYSPFTGELERVLVYLSIYPSICRSIYLSIHLSIYIYVYMYIHIYLQDQQVSPEQSAEAVGRVPSYPDDPGRKVSL